MFTFVEFCLKFNEFYLQNTTLKYLQRDMVVFDIIVAYDIAPILVMLVAE